MGFWVKISRISAHFHDFQLKLLKLHELGMRFSRNPQARSEMNCDSKKCYYCFRVWIFSEREFTDPSLMMTIVPKNLDLSPWFIPLPFLELPKKTSSTSPPSLFQRIDGAWTMNMYMMYTLCDAKNYPFESLLPNTRNQFHVSLLLALKCIMKYFSSKGQLIFNLAGNWYFYFSITY